MVCNDLLGFFFRILLRKIIEKSYSKLLLSQGINYNELMITQTTIS